MAEQKDFDDVKNNTNSNVDEKVEYKPPRLFRNGFVDKILKVLYPGYEGRGISQRNFREK